MVQSFLKWFSSLATGAALAALGYLAGIVGSGPEGVDPFVATFVAGAVAKFVGWLTGKIPA